MTLLILLSAPSLAATLTVDPDDSSAYATISEALEEAEDGDVIDVVAGEFEDCLELEEISVEITGAGEGATLIDGNGTCDPQISLDDGATLTLSGMTISNRKQPAITAEDSFLVLDGVTIEESGDSSSYYYGGAAVVLEGSELSVTGCTFTGNEGYYGAHIHLNDRSSGSIQSSSFDDGYAIYGGAIYVDGISELSAASNTFQDNQAYYYGGAAYLTGHSSFSSSGNTWSDNTTEGFYSYNYGGAIYATELAELHLEGDALEGNTAAYGGALYVGGYATVNLTDSSFADNTAYTGGAVYVAEASSLTDAGSSFVGNTATSSAGAVIINNSSRFDATGSVFEGNRSEGSAGAIYLYADSSGTIDGATFTDNSAYNSGGAMRLYSVDETLVIRDSTFEGNLAETGYGGALDAQYYADIQLDGVVFSGNEAASYGGAITTWYDISLSVVDSSFEGNHSQTTTSGAISYYDYYGDNNELFISGSSFVGNTAATDAGAVAATYADNVLIEGSSFEGNLASTATAEDYYSEGGALYLYGNDEITVTHSSFCGNEAGSGGAVYLYYNTNDTWTNNVFSTNTALRGGALMHYYTTDTIVVNNTFAGNAARDDGAVEYFIYGSLELVNNALIDSGGSDAVYLYDSTSAGNTLAEYDAFYGNDLGDGGGYWEPDEDSEGHVFDDPLFVDWSNDSDCSNDDLRLAAGSPLRDAGDPDILDGDGTRSDIGAFGGPDAEAQDHDEDGYTTADDCDDFDPAVNPGAEEVCDDLDNDCDGEIDGASATDATTWYTDADADGWGSDPIDEASCDQALETAAQDGDCDDSDPSVNPEAEEIPDDGIDNDCDGEDEITEGDDGGDTDVGQGGGDDTGGCGCSAAAAPAQASWLLLLPVLIGLRRRS